MTYLEYSLQSTLCANYGNLGNELFLLDIITENEVFKGKRINPQNNKVDHYIWDRYKL